MTSGGNNFNGFPANQLHNSKVFWNNTLKLVEWRIMILSWR